MYVFYFSLKSLTMLIVYWRIASRCNELGVVSLEQAKEELQRIGKRGKGHDVRRAVDIGTELLRSNAQHKRDAASFAKVRGRWMTDFMSCSMFNAQKEQAFKELRKNYAEQTEVWHTDKLGCDCCSMHEGSVLG